MKDILKFVFLTIVLSCFVTGNFVLFLHETKQIEVVGTIQEIYNVQARNDSFESLTIKVGDKLHEVNGGHHHYKVGDQYKMSIRRDETMDVFLIIIKIFTGFIDMIIFAAFLTYILIGEN